MPLARVILTLLATINIVALGAPVLAAPNGKELAAKYCASCHVFPEPGVLTKTMWAHHVLPQMALWLGIERANYENFPDGKILERAGLYPATPLLKEEEWFAIWDYYVTNAPFRFASTNASKPPAETSRFTPRKINLHAGVPMVSLVHAAAKGEGFFVGDAYAGVLGKIDSAGKLLQRARVGGAPVSLRPMPSGVLLTVIGNMFPSDIPKGAVVNVPIVERSFHEPQELLSNLQRPVDTLSADLNGDNREDLVLCAFGNKLGRFAWYERKPDNQFEEHVLFDRSGAVKAEIVDLNGDNKKDIIVLMAQGREGLFACINQGNGEFRIETIVEHHPGFGYASFILADVNQDNAIDILTVNGDIGDFPSAPRPYHGIRILLNNGKNSFTEKVHLPFGGAYGVRAADFDADNDVDLAAISFYPDYDTPHGSSFLYFENKGGMRFEPFFVPATDSGRWITMDSGDVDGDGDTDILLGSFIPGPTTIPIPLQVREKWKTDGAAVLLLENKLK